MGQRNDASSLVDVVNQHLESNEIDLPLFDETTSRLQQMIQQREFEVDKVTQLLESDPVLTGSLLKLANSSFFGGIQKVVTVHEAVMRLGIKQVAELVILDRQKRAYVLKDPLLHGMVQDLWRHAVGCASGSKWLAGKLRLNVEPQAFLAGLLHDLGKLLLLRVLDDLKAAGTLPFELSREMVGQVLQGHHSAQGYALMQKWNLPDEYAVVARDHEDKELPEGNLLLLVVRLADKACNRLGIGVRGEVDVDVATCPEAEVLAVSEVLTAELEIQLEDAMELAV